MASKLWFSLTWTVVCLLHNFCQAIPPEAFPSRNGSSCDPLTDYSADCQFKAAECRLISAILNGVAGGQSSTLLNCSQVLQIPLNANLLSQLSPDLQYSRVSSFDLIEFGVLGEPDQAQMRKCILEAGNMTNGSGKLDRSSIANKFKSHLFWAPTLSATLSKAAFACPEPINYDMKPFYSCLKGICMENAPSILEAITESDHPFNNEILVSLKGVPTSFPYLAAGFVY